MAPWVFGLLAILLVIGTSYAHAELVAASPAPGEVLVASPELIWLQYSEPLRPGSKVTLFGTGFRAVAGVQAVLDLTEPTRLVATVPVLVPDDYTVQWTSVSVDGDTLSGSYTFRLQPANAAGRGRPSMACLLGLILAALVLGWLWLRQRNRVASRKP